MARVPSKGHAEVSGVPGLLRGVLQVIQGGAGRGGPGGRHEHLHLAEVSSASRSVEHNSRSDAHHLLMNRERERGIEVFSGVRELFLLLIII